ncbi:protein kinase, putative [Hepatocystis sp. ex Piliocolobus tephrosceles]|nr:protein kinase, putative [Hepatocystis sp. ex Piliocolobus tephrosceles]
MHFFSYPLNTNTYSLFKEKVNEKFNHYINDGKIILSNNIAEEVKKNVAQNASTTATVNNVTKNIDQLKISNTFSNSLNKSLLLNILKIKKQITICYDVKFRIIHSVLLKKYKNKKINIKINKNSLSNIFKIKRKNVSYFVNQFLIIKCIYSSEYGNIYYCKNIIDNKKYCLKLFYLNLCLKNNHPIYIDNEVHLNSYLDNIINEILVVNCVCNNKNIIHIEKIFYDKKQDILMIIFPYIKYQSMYYKNKYNIYSVDKKITTINKRLNISLYSETFIKNLFIKLHTILTYLLKKSIAYVDFKPDNILLVNRPPQIIQAYTIQLKKKKKKSKPEIKLPNMETLIQNEINKNAEKKNVESKNVESKNVESKNVESKNVESKNVESKNVESKNVEKTNVESKNVEKTNVESKNVEKTNVESKNVTTLFNKNIFSNKKKKKEIHTNRSSYCSYQDLNTKKIKNKKIKYIYNINLSKCFEYDQNVRNIFFIKHKLNDFSFLLDNIDVFIQIFILKNKGEQEREKDREKDRENEREKEGEMGRQREEEKKNEEKCLDKKCTSDGLSIQSRTHKLNSFSYPCGKKKHKKKTNVSVTKRCPINKIQNKYFFKYDEKNSINFLKLYWLYFNNFPNLNINKEILTYLDLYFINKYFYKDMHIYIPGLNIYKQPPPFQQNITHINSEKLYTIEYTAKQNINNVTTNSDNYKNKNINTEKCKKNVLKKQGTQINVSLLEKLSQDINTHDTNIIKLIDFDTCFFIQKNKNIQTPTTDIFNSYECLFNVNNNNSDIFKRMSYNFGSVLYTFVYGKTPYFGKNIFEIYDNMKNDRLLFPKYRKIDQKLKSLLRNLLNNDPDKRIQFKKIKRHKWFTKS